MRTRSPSVHVHSATEARQQFSKLLKRVYTGEYRVLVEKGGIPVAAIVSPLDLEWLQSQETNGQADTAILREIGEIFRDVPDEELEREVARAVRFARESGTAYE